MAVLGPTVIFGDLTFSGVAQGDGSKLTNLDATKLNGNIPAARLSGTYNINVSGSATRLTTPRAINGTNFDGSGNITTANWGTSRTLTVGATGKAVNGSANVSWSLDEIGTYSKAVLDPRTTKNIRLNAPANAVAGRYYPVVVSGYGENQKVYISTRSSASSDPMNNCSFDGIVRSSGWTDRISYVNGVFTIFNPGERGIRSILGGTEQSGYYAFYVEARAFPVDLVVPGDANVSTHLTSVTVGNSNFVGNIADPATVAATAANKVQVLVDFNLGTGHYYGNGKLYGSGNKPSPEELGVCEKISWDARVRQGTHSRIMRLSNKELGSKAILTVGTTRNGVVVNARFLISGGHSNYANIVQLGSHGYTQIQLRLVSLDANDIAVELLDTGPNAAAGSEIIYKCEVSDIYGTVITYNTFQASTGTPRVACQTKAGVMKVDNNDVVTMDVLDARINALPRLLSGTAQPTAATGKAGDWYIVY